MTDDLRLITGRIQKLDRKRCRGAWGVADVEHYVQTPGDPKKRKTTTAVVGNGVALFAFGDTIDAVGAYEKSDYGLQFKAIRVSLAPPDTDAEMDKWFAATLPNVDVARLAAIRAVAGTTPLRDFLSSPQAAEKLITVAGITEERAELISKGTLLSRVPCSTRVLTPSGSRAVGEALSKRSGALEGVAPRNSSAAPLLAFETDDARRSETGARATTRATVSQSRIAIALSGGSRRAPAYHRARCPPAE